MLCGPISYQERDDDSVLKRSVRGYGAVGLISKSRGAEPDGSEGHMRNDDGVAYLPDTATDREVYRW